MEFGRNRRLMCLRRTGRIPRLSIWLWWRRVVFWVGAVLVAAVAVRFAKAVDLPGRLFLHFAAGQTRLPYAIAPARLTIAFVLTRRVFPRAQGSRIPQDYGQPGFDDSAAGDGVSVVRGVTSGQTAGLV